MPIRDEGLDRHKVPSFAGAAAVGFPLVSKPPMFQRIHGTGIFTYMKTIQINFKCKVHNGKYTSPMDPMGVETK